MGNVAIWRRLDVSGHDAALIEKKDGGWSLSGAAVFASASGPIGAHYAVRIDADWKTRSARVRGFRGDRAFDHVIGREPDGWYLDGGLVPGLGHLWDIDFGFTPATNLQQLRRLAPEIGQTVEHPVAWFNIGATTLVELPQTYDRRSERAYWYTAPSVEYQGLLELAPSGFIAHYPGLWAMEC